MHSGMTTKTTASADFSVECATSKALTSLVCTAMRRRTALQMASHEAQKLAPSFLDMRKQTRCLLRSLRKIKRELGA